MTETLILFRDDSRTAASLAGLPTCWEDMAMPLLLWRYLGVEILKVLLLTTAVLVVVIAFGATIKPLIQNKIDPLDAGVYALIASIPMLQFALPFAAGFAATIVMHRMVNDNEIVAMRASGVSWRSILTPSIVLGLLLTIVMLVLVNVVVPRFWRILQEMVAHDVSRIFTTAVADGEALVVGETQLFADDFIIADSVGETGADERLILLGVAAIETDKNGDPHSEFTARYATIDMHHRSNDVLLKLALVDATIDRHDDGALIFVPKAVPDAVSLPKAFASGPKTRDCFELLHLREHLEDYGPITDARERLASSLRLALGFGVIANQLARGETVELETTLGIESIRIENGVLEGTTLLGTPTLVLTQFEDGEAIRRAEVDRAELFAMDARTGALPRFELRAQTDSAVDLRGVTVMKTRWPARVRALEVPGATLKTSLWPTNASLREAAERWTAQQADVDPGLMNERIEKEERRLGNMITEVDFDITARFIQRASQSMTAVLLLVLGAVLALYLRNSLPLVIYGLAFIPAVADILLISGGEQMVKYGDLTAGTVVAFSGNAVLLLMIVVTWFRLARN